MLGHVVAGATYVLAWLPLGYWCSGLVGALRIRAALGRWPSYDQPDPSYLDYLAWPPQWLQTWALLAAVIGMCIGSGIAARRLGASRHSWAMWSPAVLIVGWVTFFALMWLDPGGLLDWWMD